MPTFEHAPIERHQALAPLSRDHYVGLVQARHLIRAADDDEIARRKAVAEFVDAWDTEIVQHFRDEERLLSDLMDKADRERLLDEHERLSNLVSRVRALLHQVDPEAVVLRELGELLERHIRWEERDLFNRIQERVNLAQLAELQRLTDVIETTRKRDARRSQSKYNA